jgi:glycosyltransferase involved in cell wall biosynthesis
LVGAAVEVVECDPPIPRGRGSRRRLGRAAADFLAAHPVDLLFVPGNYLWPILPGLARLPESRRPGIVAQIGTPLYRHGRGPLAQLEYNFRTRRRLRQVDAAVSLSDAMTRDADMVLGRKITRRLPLPALDDLAAPPVAGPLGGKLVVAAGRLVEEKGFDVALRAFARLNDPHARLAILGEGPRRARLEALAVELGVADRLVMPGYVADIGPWLRKARVFLLSSFYEGYAAVVVEALAAGRPVVATACTPAAYELLDRPERGVVAPIGDVEALAEGLRRVLAAEPADPMTIAAAVDGYRIGPIAGAYLNLFDTVVLGRPRPSAQPAQGLIQLSVDVQRQAQGRERLAFAVDQGDAAG